MGETSSQSVVVAVDRIFTGSVKLDGDAIGNVSSFQFPNELQSTLIISNSLISNNRLSRSEYLVPVLTQRSTDSHYL